jgi:hypothetical protein
MTAFGQTTPEWSMMGEKTAHGDQQASTLGGTAYPVRWR